MSLDATERRKLRGKSLALYALLQDGRWHDQNELAAAAGFRYSARKFDLERRGHVIEKRKVGPLTWEYRLVVEAQGRLFA